MLSFVGNVILVKAHVVELQHSFASNGGSSESNEMTSADADVSDSFHSCLHALPNRYSRHIASWADASCGSTLDMPICRTHVKLSRSLPCKVRVVWKAIVESDVIGLIYCAHICLTSLMQLLDRVLLRDAEQVLWVLLAHQQLLLARGVLVSALHSVLVLLAHENLIVIYR